MFRMQACAGSLFETCCAVVVAVVMHAVVGKPWAIASAVR